MEKLVKEKEKKLRELELQEESLKEEKKKNEEEVEELEGLVKTNPVKQENDPEGCHPCMNIYSVSNHIAKSNLELALHKELVTFEQMILVHNQKEKAMLDNLIERIHDIVKEVYPDSKVKHGLTEAHVYGSYATGLCLPWSDIDILLEFNSSYTSDDYLQAIDFHLSDKHSDIIKSKKYIKTANYPVLKLECTPEYANKRLDITVKEVRHSGMSCVGLVREYLKEYEGILRPLVYVLKQILFLANLNDPFTGGVNSYALVLMVVALIQAEMKSLHLPPMESKRHILQNLGGFFLRFLNTYGNEVDINQREVRPSRATDFLLEEQFPLKAEPAAVNQLILRDPLMWTNNVTRSSFNFYIVRMIFSYSYFSVYQPCVCEISQLMNNPQSLSETSSIEAIFNKKVKNSENMDQAATLLILNKILNSYKNPIFTSYISKKQYPV